MHDLINFACFLECSNVSCLVSEIAQYEGRVKQIFLTSVQASTLEDSYHNRARIEFAGNVKGVKGLVAKEKHRDTLVKVISHNRGMLEGTLFQTSVRPQQVYKKKSILDAVVRQSAQMNVNTEMGSKRILEAIKTASYKRDNQKEVEKLLGHISSDEYFPVDTICPYLGLRKEPYIRLKNSLPRNEYCVRRQPSVEECQKATRDYEVESPPLRCEELMEKDLCTITDKYRSNINAQVKIRCDIGICGNPVYVASLDPETGQLQEQRKWQKFASKTEIEGNLPSVIIRNSQNGFNFCLVQCVRNNTSQLIRTVLSFPPVLGVTNSHGPKPVNLDINVMVLNSVSRVHFYRSLPETVATIRNVVYDNSITASALDFEFLQSFGPHPRVRLSGKNGKTPTQNSEISTLFAELKKLGYHNIFQTDQCWYDQDAFTTDFQSKMETEGAREEFRRQWAYFQNMTMEHVDDTGMTYLACEAKPRYSVPNQLDGNRLKASCLNGRYFFNYIFDHIDKTRHAKRVSKTKTTFFFYTHLTLPTDKLGAGIKQIDKQLSTFLNNMAHEENSVTIVTSDHGPTTTKYSLNSVEGRYEIYDPIFFMIIPKGVALKLGKQQMEALVKNQHRLISPSDLHNTLVSMANVEKRHLASRADRGLLAEIPENRTCKDIGVEVGALCKCRGWETWFPDNDLRFAWIAEFVLGELNNKLQDSTKKLRFLNKGNDGCQRLVGYAFEKIYHNKKSVPFVLSLDLIAHPGRQVFETHVQLPKHFPSEARETISPSQTKEDLIKIIRFRRAGLSQDFTTLSDSDVPFNHCLNDVNVLQNNTGRRRNFQAADGADGKYSEDILKLAHHAKHFGSRPIIQVLDRRDKCLLLITRMHSNKTLAFEASNICVDKTFVMKVDMINRGEGHAFITVRLPMIVYLAPGTYRFLLSAYQPRGVINWKPKIAFKMVKT